MAPARRVPHPSGTEERTARIVLRLPDGWARAAAPDADLRVVLGAHHAASTGGDDAGDRGAPRRGVPSAEGTATTDPAGQPVTITARSRPSERTIAEESRALLDRLPGSVDGVLVVGCDPWRGAGAPGRLVEYTRGEPSGDVFVSHLLLATGRHRIDVIAERALAAVAATDDAVFDVLDSVRAADPTRAAESASRAHGALEELVPAPHPTPDIGTPVDAAAVTALQGMAGRRWNPAVLRSEGGRTLIDAGLVGRFGAVPAGTTAILAPWAADAAPVTLEQHVDGGGGSRLQAWIADGTVTVLDGTEDDGFRIGAHSPEHVVAMLAGRLDLGPVWTVPFRTSRLASSVLERRMATGLVGAALPAPVREADPVLARFWEAPWTVSSLRRPGRSAPVTIVRASGLGFARVGRTAGDETAFRVEAPANLYRLLVRTVLAD